MQHHHRQRDRALATHCGVISVCQCEQMRVLAGIQVMLQIVQNSTCLRIDGDVMVQHSGCCLLAVEVEVGMLS